MTEREAEAHQRLRAAKAALAWARETPDNAEAWSILRGLLAMALDDVEMHDAAASVFPDSSSAVLNRDAARRRLAEVREAMWAREWQ